MRFHVLQRRVHLELGQEFDTRRTLRLDALELQLPFVDLYAGVDWLSAEEAV